ncbi:MAG: hypothetical protein K0R24_1075 [Gammaproteobacteria bacterium]|jgi:hypothetical protein|nr:hypothetical protein [Gammaproteobacteria bacterium]
MFRSDGEKEDLKIRLHDTQTQNIKLEELCTILHNTLSSPFADSRVKLVDQGNGTLVNFENEEEDDEEEENTPLTEEGDINEEDEREEEYKATSYEIDEGSFISGEVPLVKQLEAADQHNKALRDAIKAHYQQVEQIIADKSKIRNIILTFFEAIRKLMMEKNPHAAKSTLKQFEEKSVDLYTRKSDIYVPGNKLNECASIKELTENVTHLIDRLNEDRTIEEKAGKLLQWVAKNCKAAYNYTLSQSSSAVQVVIRAIQSSKPPSVTEQSIFSFNDDDNDFEVKKIRAPSNKLLRGGDL